MVVFLSYSQVLPVTNYIFTTPYINVEQVAKWYITDEILYIQMLRKRFGQEKIQPDIVMPDQHRIAKSDAEAAMA